MNAEQAIETNDRTPERSGHFFAEPFVYLRAGAGPLKGRQVGLVPGAEVPLLPVDLPRGLRGHAREQVAERQLRDMLDGGADTLEIRPFHGPGGEKSWTRALVAGRDLMGQWRAQAGGDGRAVLPDYLALPAAPDLWVVTVSEGNVLARLGVEDGFSAPLPLALQLLQQALAEAEPMPGGIFCIGAIPAELETFFAGHDVPVLTTDEALQQAGIAAPKPLANGELGFDLRRDPRAARARLAGRVLPWRWPVLVALIAAGLWAGAQMLAIRGVETQTQAYRDATLQTVRAHFVPNGPILDVRTQVSRALAEARVAATGTGETVAPLDLLGLAADVMTARKAQPDLVEYRAGNGLSASVRVENFAAAEDLATALRDAGLAVTVVESRASEDEAGVRTELVITAPEVRDE